MDLSELDATLYDVLGYKSIPTADVTDRLHRFLNMGYRKTMAQKGIGSKLRRLVMPFTTVAGSPWAVLPQAAAMVHYVTDRLNNRTLYELTLSTERMRDPGLTFQSGTPYGYIPYNLASPVYADPSAAGQLKVVSSAAETPTAYVQVIRGAGYQQLSSVALTGITPINIGPSDSAFVQKFYLSAAATGDISLTDAASNVLAVIPIGRRKARYSRLHIVDVPSSVLTFYADVELYINDLVNPLDEPIFHEDFHDILVHYVCAQEYKKRDKLDMYGTELTEMRGRIAELRAYMFRPQGFDGNRLIQTSQLGPFFPAGT